MKKGISISLSLLMLVAVLHISVATHYCGGKEVAMKVSLAGKLADCGMEGSEKQLPQQGTNISNHCCDNIITFYGIDNNYSPTYSFLTESFHYNFLVWSVPAEFPIKSQADNKPSYSNVSPPGALMSTSVDLSDICVFRI
jgi:uncharacterized protein (UPF0333 family)